jgi:hypothetical protein
MDFWTSKVYLNMKEKSINYFARAFLLFTIFSCEETTIINNYNGNGEEKTYSIEGYAQKGPFIVGTDVTVSELSEDLFPTGRVFFATILNDEGFFELPGVLLASPYIQIKIRGRYFSETGGYVPTEELTLYSLADITKSETINVNILTHLEKERVEYLVQKENFSFEDAKKKAQNEVLKIFEWDNTGISDSELLNISENNQGGAVLLAMSSIFEAIEFISRLETITNFKVDFAKDGILNTQSIQNRLLTAAAAVDHIIVRENMESKYESEIPDFESELQSFIENSTYVNYFDIIFPKTHNGYTNLLRVNNSILNSSTNYAFIVNAYPTEIEVGNISNSFGLEVYFPASQEFPNNAVNNFKFLNSSWGVTWIVEEGRCYISNETCAWTSWGIDLPDNSSVFVLPVQFSGTGTINVNYQWDIDNIFIPRYLPMSW